MTAIKKVTAVARPREKFSIGSADQSQRKQFISFTAEDVAMLAEMRPLIERNASAIVEKFYAQMLKFTEAQGFFKDEAALSQAKAAHLEHLLTLFRGDYGAAYFNKRLEPGVAPERLGLSPKWYIGGNSNFMCLIIPLLVAHYGRWQLDKLTRAIQALIKIRNLDQQIVVDTYIGSMVDELSQNEGQIRETAVDLWTSAAQILASAGNLAGSAASAAASVIQTTTTVQQVRQTAEVASQKAKVVADSSHKAAQNSENGRKSTEDVAAGMNLIRQQMEAIAISMGRLSEQSQTIGQIIATVDDLASQSNLLAVNAAIEAAKAGEHGRGFGVVAQEVKSLAEQSRQATNQVRTILSDIQKATTAAVMATEQGAKAVANGERQTEVARESIQALAGSVVEASLAATQIAAASQEQLAGVSDLATSMEGTKQSSAQNVASAKQLETSARDLNELGQRLQQMVERSSAQSAAVS